MIKLLGRKSSGNVQKVLWALREMGVDFTQEEYGRQFNNTGGDYLRLNPNAKVPTLLDGDLVIWESNTILRYLGNKSGGRFYATDAGSRSQIEKWMDWQLATLDGPYLSIFREIKTPADRRSTLFAAAVTQLGAALAILDGAIAGNGWVAGKSQTIADFCLGPIVHRCLNFGVDTPSLENVRAWHKKLCESKIFTIVVAG